jgi:hypothetical protein
MTQRDKVEIIASIFWMLEECGSARTGDTETLWIEDATDWSHNALCAVQAAIDIEAAQQRKKKTKRKP